MNRLENSMSVSAILIVTICNCAFGQNKSENEKPSRIDSLLSRATSLKGNNYLKQRGEILTLGKQPLAQKVLAEISADDRRDFKKRLLARACLLYLASPNKADEFKRNLLILVREYQKCQKGGPRHHLPSHELLLRADPVDLLEILQDGPQRRRRDLRKKTQPARLIWAKALKAILVEDTALFAEGLIWHTNATLGEVLSSHLDEKERESKGALPPEAMGQIAKYYLGQLLAIRPKGKSDAVAILTEWAKRDPNSSQFVLKDLRAVALLKETSEADRKLAIKAIIRVGVALGKLDLPFDVKDYAASCLVRLVDETTLPTAGRVEAVRGCVQIGGKKTLRYMKDIAKYSTNEKIKSAAEKAIRQIRRTKPTSTTRPAEKPTTKPTRN